jgi:hypothetical protein
VTLALRIPTFLLGLIVAPALARSQWLIRKFPTQSEFTTDMSCIDY